MAIAFYRPADNIPKTPAGTVAVVVSVPASLLTDAGVDPKKIQALNDAAKQIANAASRLLNGETDAAIAAKAVADKAAIDAAAAAKKAALPTGSL